MTIAMSAILLLLQKAQDSTAVVWKYSGVEGIEQGNGVMITMIGMLVVFTALSITSLVIWATGKTAGERPKKVQAAETGEVKPAVRPAMSGEIVAAISFALQSHLFELHDDEQTVITIRKISRPYSPWSSKLHSMTRPPHISFFKR